MSIVLTSTLACISACTSDTQWKGQDPIQKTNTLSVPVEVQWKGTFDLGSGIYCNNNFEGARLNGAILRNDTIITLITPENTPINESPWYAFRIWADTSREVVLKLTYPEGYRHRYYPKLSLDGVHWAVLDSVRYAEHEIDTADNPWRFPNSVSMRLEIGPDTLWVAAQEMLTSTHVNAWCDSMAEMPFVTRIGFGKSSQGRPIHGLRIGTGSDDSLVMIISRQHPPEVTGYLAMRAFVETLCEETNIASDFRGVFTTYVIPLMNPDGVDNGHWRHNAGGIDTNRDWEDFNQPEPLVVRNFMEGKAEAGSTFYLGIDFHSTWEDIFYTFKPEKKGNMPGLVTDLLDAIDRELSGYTPNIRPGLVDTPRISSSGYFFYSHGAESFTYEIGDNTPRDFVRKKGEVSAHELMRIMLKYEASGPGQR